MPPTLSAPLAAALERERERFNALVAERVASGQRFDAESLAAHLGDAVSPAIDAVYRVDRDSVGPVTETLFRMTLDLVGRDLAGPGSRYPSIAAGWRTIFPPAAPLLVRAPRQLAGSLTNAIYNVAAAREEAVGWWIDAMAAVARHCGEVDELLGAGSVLAWRAGLAHFRDAALRACRSLPPDLGALALGAWGAAVPFSTVVDRLERDPWLDPALAARDELPPPQLRVVAVAGAFRGFGGPFRVPPMVYLRDGMIVAKDDAAAWVLTADRLGATWHRTGDDGLLARTFDGAAVDRDGGVRIGGLKASHPGLAKPWSQAFDGTTLAVTIQRSHRVWLLACTP